jgi:hypothetical protein
MNVTVSITEAVDMLKKNREVHIADYKEALTVWREDVVAYTKVLEEWASKDAYGGRPNEPIRPRNYLGEYDKLIAKLGRHQDETITLTDSEYSTIFEDAFYWQGQFQRQKSPIYTMGSPDAASFVRGGTLSADKITSGVISNAQISNAKFGSTDELHVPLEDE